MKTNSTVFEQHKRVVLENIDDEWQTAHQISKRVGISVQNVTLVLRHLVSYNLIAFRSIARPGSSRLLGNYKKK